MVNFPQADDEKELVQEAPDVEALQGVQEGSDIQFDELVDIDAIQKKLRDHMVEFGDSAEDKTGGVFDEAVAESSTGEIIKKIDLPSISETKKAAAPIDPNSKKYVVYVDPDNINFMENLSIDDRKLIINKILKEQSAEAKKIKSVKEKEQFIIHALIVTVTAIIFFPVMFWVVNKALEATIVNYKTTKENFVRLYKQQGKIKPVSDSSPDDYNY